MWPTLLRIRLIQKCVGKKISKDHYKNEDDQPSCLYCFLFEKKYQPAMMMTINQLIDKYFWIKHIQVIVYMLLFRHSEQSMESHRQAYFHDRPNISLVQIDVKNLSQDTIYMYNVQESKDNQSIEYRIEWIGNQRQMRS